MIDYDLLIGTTFLLLLATIIGGTFLLYPISRKLGALLDAKTREKTAVGARPEDLEQLTNRLAALEQQMQAGAERQEFLEKLLLQRQTPQQSLPRHGEAPSAEPPARG